MPLMGRLFISMLLLLNGTLSLAATPFSGGLFDLYQLNRQERVPNYVTEDFLLLAYTLIDRQVLVELEDKTMAPLLGELIHGLAERLKAVEDQKDPVTEANQNYLAVLQALWSGDAEGLQGVAAKEFKLVMAAKGITPSPLWGYAMDYSQFQPRGRYSETPELQRYFRTVRYANTALFAITPTQATGVTEQGAERMARQARQLVLLMQDDKALQPVRQRLLEQLTGRMGQGKDLTDEDLKSTTFDEKEGLSKALRKLERKPVILGGIVDLGRLEDKLTPQEALMGWRLIPSIYTPESAVFQQMVYPNSGQWQPKACKGCPKPFGWGRIEDLEVKAYPTALELMALLGSEAAEKRLIDQGEKAFSNYPSAVSKAKGLLEMAEGMQQQRLEFMRKAHGLPEGKEGADRLEALLAFWTGLRYSEQLYVKQSYTPVGKGISIPKPRAGARLEGSTDLYKGLLQLSSKQFALSKDDRWERFQQLMQQVVELSAKDALDAEDEAFLNELDQRLVSLTGGKDKPIVVDVHTHAAEGKVVEEAVGFARLVQADKARGARLDHHEFKQPLSERLTDARWAARLVQEMSKGSAQ